MNLEQYAELKKSYAELVALAHNYFAVWCQVNGVSQRQFDFISLEDKSEYIYIHWDAYYCGDRDSGSEGVLPEVLFNPDGWREHLAEQIRERERRQATEREQRRKKDEALEISAAKRVLEKHGYRIQDGKSD